VVIRGGDESDGFTNSFYQLIGEKSVSIQMVVQKTVTFVTEHHHTIMAKARWSSQPTSCR
jgi:hypothetical protein